MAHTAAKLKNDAAYELDSAKAPTSPSPLALAPR